MATGVVHGLHYQLCLATAERKITAYTAMTTINNGIDNKLRSTTQKNFPGIIRAQMKAAIVKVIQDIRYMLCMIRFTRSDASYPLLNFLKTKPELVVYQ